MLTGTGTAIRRELRLLRRRSLGVCAVGFAIVVMSLCASAQTTADSNWDLVQQDAAQVATEHEACLSGPDTADCAALHERRLELHQQYEAEQLQRFELSRATQDPVGAVGVAAGFMASVPGLLALAVLAALVVASEWTFGTVRVVLARSPERLPFVLGKCVATFVGGLGLLLGGWLGLLLLGLVSRQVWNLPPMPPTLDVAGYAVGSLGRSLLVVVVFALVGTAVACVVRHQLGSLGVLTTGILASLALTVDDATFTWSPAYWVARVMRWSSDNQMVDHAWVDRFPALDPRPELAGPAWASVLALVAMALAAVVVAWWSCARAEVER